ncbi:MAG: Phospho-N-acetylmuramoyl-pentapeptide-transferase [Firmicutes bacterium ADurb.Bin193]|nr:MAG: Phospho-N-acetylmuramoyl-pentapeptide-transferase [Firmicutes bacterium ADurb.Bin193]
MNIYSAPLIAFLLVLILMPAAIPILIKLKFGQSIREIGPSWHKKKSGTPTMGGIVIIIAAAASLVFNYKQLDSMVWYALLCAAGFGFVGFVDDSIKIIFKRNLGLRAWQKLALQLLVAVIFVFGGLASGALSTEVIIPFMKRALDFSWFYIPFTVLSILFVTNSVNLTDGVDGLASAVTVAVMAFFGFSSLIFSTPLSVFCFTMVGALLGFFIFNRYPAKIFMGDTGSLFLGGAVAAVAFLSGNPFILILVGIVYIVEAMSVILQVASFKLTGKRIFKMSPIHHHFEMCGWSETKIVAVFTAVTAVLAGVSYLIAG